ncbi:MAG: amino acid ABC transporter substrate-binding protein [Candidatus Bathyarchaeia archaeon]
MKSGRQEVFEMYKYKADVSGIAKLQAIIIIAVVVIAAVVGAIYYVFWMRTPEKTEILIGGSIALSGGEVEPALGIWAGIMAAVEEINTRYGGIYVPELGKKLPVRYIYYDDENDAGKAATYYERLITVDKVDFVVTCFNDANLLAATTICEKYRMPIICAGAVSTEITARGLKYTFDYFLKVTSWSEVYVEFFDWLRKNVPPEVAPKRIACLNTNDDLIVFGPKIKELAEKIGFEVPYVRDYPEPGTEDFTPFILDMKRLNIDIVATCGHLNDILMLTRQMVELGFCPKMLIYTGMSFFSPSLKEALGKYMEEVVGWYSEPLTPELAAEIDRINAICRKYYERMMPGTVPPAFTTVFILKEAIEHVGLDREKVREYIATTTFTFPWESKPIKFDEKGLASQISRCVAQIQNGQYVRVWPPEYKEADLIYPMTPWDKR